MSAYLYTDRDLMAAPERYFYTALEGVAFLRAFAADRRAFVAKLPDQAVSEPQTAPPGRITALSALTDPTDAVLTRFARRFEVTRRIHAHYDTDLKKGDGPADAPAPYARLARLLGARYARSAALADLNALLKLCDLLASQPPATLAPCAQDTRAALTAELTAIVALTKAKGIADAL